MPIGVIILPRLAAIVCKTMTGIIISFRSAIDRIITANGTKVISATSFVISMLEKKQSATSSRLKSLVDLAFFNSVPAR